MKVALCNRGMTVEAVQQARSSGEPWHICNLFSFMRPILFGPVFFRKTRQCSGGCRLERGGMPLHDAVGINCAKEAATENQGAGVKYIICICAKGCILDDGVCVLSDLT